VSEVNYFELLKLAMPETILVIAALVVLAVDLGAMRSEARPLRMLLAGLISCVGCAAAIFWMFSIEQHANFLNGSGMLVVDPLTQLVKQALLVLTVFTVMVSIETNFTEHVGEYFALLLLATVGMMFLVSSENILMIFVALELTSLSLYVLTAFNKQNIKSAEAALKYFLFGGMAAAFTLFGLSLLYGLTGEINLIQIAAKLKGRGLDPLLIVAIVMTVIGFGFKIAAVPFHLWAPDAYQGAPTPSAAFVASGSKVASVFVLAKVMMLGFAGAEGSGNWRQYVAGWVPVLAILAAGSMLLGNLVAIVQSSVKRLLAYSAIAHAGYMLLGVMAHGEQGFASLLYYAATYGLTTIGAFAVVSVVQERVGDDRISDFAGLSRRAPLLSFCMMIFILSLAGIPPLAGFFGKFYLFTAGMGSDPKSLGMLWLVALAIVMSAVSLYYYLQVLKQIYVADAPSGDPGIHTSFLSKIILSLLAFGVLVLGIAPNLILERLLAAIKVVGY